MNIAVIWGEGRAAPHVMLDMADALRDLGHNTIMLNLTELSKNVQQNITKGKSEIDTVYEQIEAMLGGVVLDLAIGYAQSVMIVINNKGTNYWEDNKIPYISVWYDSPMIQTQLEVLSNLNSDIYYQFIWDKVYVEQFELLNIKNVFYEPIGISPKKFFKIKVAEKKYDVVFCGSYHPMRYMMLKRIYEYFGDKLKLGVFGYEWEQIEHRDIKLYDYCIIAKKCSHEQLNDLLNSATIGLNITMPQGLTSLNMRCYETMAAGTLLLTDYKEDIDTLFDGKILYYRNFDGLCKNLEYRIKAGDSYYTDYQKKIIENSTYKIRCESMLGKL